VASVKCHHPVDRPARSEPACGLELGQLVGSQPGEAVAYIEAGIGPLRPGVEAVVRLGAIGHEVLSVAGVVDRVRPYVVGLSNQPVETARHQADLQRVVGGTGCGLGPSLSLQVGSVGSHPSVNCVHLREPAGA
jgi:hypothetical protein